MKKSLKERVDNLYRNVIIYKLMGKNGKISIKKFVIFLNPKLIKLLIMSLLKNDFLYIYFIYFLDLKYRSVLSILLNGYFWNRYFNLFMTIN
jgi:hypothetical protein